jgi:hypothetical protein
MTTIRSIAAALILAGVAVPASAMPHAKPGFWSTTTTTSMNGGPQGFRMPARTLTATFCMTPEQANADAPKPPNPSCAVQNIRNDGRTVSADMVCHGRMEGRGHFSTTYDSDTHYRSQMTMAMNGMTMNNTTEAKWLKADCLAKTR